MIPYGKQDINQADIDAVLEVLQSDFLTQGPKVPEFEAALMDLTGAQYAYAVNSATSALHIACMALELGPNDILWTSPNSFVASANCALYCGAQVDFVDIDPRTYNMCPTELAHKLAQAVDTNTLPKVVVPVHLCGQSCDMQAIYALSQQYGFKIIEDASHAIGGKYLDRYVGSCEFSDITVFSFHPVKIVTTAEGGAALTNDPGIAKKLALSRGHGITRDPEQMVQPPHGAWYYEQLALGYNYRMTDLQAALGISQMTRLDNFVAARYALAQRYNELLVDLPVCLPFQDNTAQSSLHLYVIRLKLNELTMTHCEVFDALRANGIGVNLHYIPIHLHPYYQQMGFSQGDFPQAEAYYQEAISLPLFHTMSVDEQDQVVRVLSECLLMGQSDCK